VAKILLQLTFESPTDVFLPTPDNLLVNLKECRELINDLLQQLPKRFANEHDNKSALGAALQAAFKLMVSCVGFWDELQVILGWFVEQSPTGGRVTVFQTCLPNIGPGALLSR
jgi:protein transport protein SEC24